MHTRQISRQLYTILRPTFFASCTAKTNVKTPFTYTLRGPKIFRILACDKCCVFALSLVAMLIIVESPVWLLYMLCLHRSLYETPFSPCHSTGHCERCCMDSNPELLLDYIVSLHILFLKT